MRALLSVFVLVAPLLSGGAALGRHPAAAQRQAETDVGFLDVSSDPSAAKILIDDGDIGQTTPQHHLPVRVGPHRLTLVTGDGARKLTVGFRVEAGQTKKLTLYLGK